MAKTQEGAIELDVPARPAGAKGPGAIGDGPFYNPAMQFSRDLSVLLVEERLQTILHDKPFVAYDGLAASGARGIRLAKECRPRADQEFLVVLNDREPDAIGRIERHIHANGVEACTETRQSDYTQGFGDDHFDYIDIDPFGSPMPFIDGALRHVRQGGIVAATATDVAALCGVHPSACRRRYDAIPWHAHGMHEVALRILAGAIIRHAARYDKTARPVLSHATDHYVRVYMEVRRGARRADEGLKQLAFAVEDHEGTRFLQRRDAPIPGDARRVAGPLWAGPLHDADLLHALQARLPEHPQLEPRTVGRFLERAIEEVDAPAMIYDVGELASGVGVSPPRFTALQDALRNQGYSCTRCHYAPEAIRTEAPRPIIDKTVLELVSTR